MIHVGIDFSLNSPGICIQDHKNNYHFLSFFNYGKRIWDEEGIRIPKAFTVHKELSDLDALSCFAYNREVTSKEFLYRERQKLNDAENISSLITDIMITLHGTENVKIALEGFSYGSKGNSFIDIIQYNTFLRSKLNKLYGNENISVYQPSHVKKSAGKGNANKHYMIKAFQDDVLDDKDLRKTKIWKWVQGKDYSMKIPKPLDDLVDSYFILNANK